MQGSDLKERLRAPMPTRVVGSTPISGIREIDWDWPKIEAERTEAASEIERLEAERDEWKAQVLKQNSNVAHNLVRAEAAEAQRDQIAEAARTYFERYCQDEAEDVENCVCGAQQHEDAKALQAALSLLEQKP